MSHLKIINASRGLVHEYENVQRKLFNCNANIYFNRHCHQKRPIPNLAEIKIPTNSPTAKSTQRKTQNLRIKDEIKYLYLKNQQLNYRLYQLHLSLANTWGNTWQYIQDRIEEKLKKSKYDPNMKNLTTRNYKNYHENKQKHQMNTKVFTPEL